MVLGCLIGDHDINVMAAVVHKYKNMVVYFDHENNIGVLIGVTLYWIHLAPLPKVFSPKKVEVVEKKAGEKLPIFYIDLRNKRVE